jgi:hypothetical protein
MVTLHSSGARPKTAILGKVKGSGADRMNGVMARVSRRDTRDFGLASQPFFGLLAIQLAYQFVICNLNSKPTLPSARPGGL